MYVGKGGRERMMDMRWRTQPRDKIYYNVLNDCVCVCFFLRGGFVGRGDLEGGDWVCAGFLCVFWGGRTL